MQKYSYSTDQESYHGTFDSMAAAIAEAAAGRRVGDSFWIGENVDPPQPETLWRADDWLEHVACQDEFAGDYADGWYGLATDRQQAELESLVRPIMAAWLDRHGLRPTFFNIAYPVEVVLVGVVEGSFGYEYRVDWSEKDCRDWINSNVAEPDQSHTGGWTVVQWREAVSSEIAANLTHDAAERT